ncbi:hypothetical protein CXT94_09815 [Akkermansia muciniphila]|jgi:hypothetical protein|nr:hypothetical protein CXT94_09815 [Akkermansia muciniphila]
MLEGFFQRSVVWVVLAAGLDDGGAEPLFHMAGRRFVLEKSRFARKGLCTEGMVRSITKDTVRLWRHSRIMNPSGLSLDVRVPEVRSHPQTREGRRVPPFGFSPAWNQARC